jgi:hypothetical protein
MLAEMHDITECFTFYTQCLRSPKISVFLFHICMWDNENKFFTVYLLTDLEIFPCACSEISNNKLIKLIFKMKENNIIVLK